MMKAQRDHSELVPASSCPARGTRWLAAITVAALAAMAGLFLDGCSGGGTPGASVQTQSVSDLIAAAAVNGRGPSVFEPVVLPSGSDYPPILVGSSVIQPDAAYPNGQIELTVTSDSYGAESPTLIAAAGYAGYIQTPFPGDASLGVRSIMPSSFVPGQTLHVSIRLSGSTTSVPEFAADTPPAGWAVSNVSAGGQFDLPGGQIKWSFPAGAFPQTVSYDVMAPADAESVVGFVGWTSGSNRGETDLLGGDQIAAPQSSRGNVFGAGIRARSDGSPGLSSRAIHRGPPPPTDVIEISPTVPVAEFNAQLLIVEDTISGLSAPLAVLVRNGVVLTAPTPIGGGEG
ncbi:MAG TPA: hypothetical protein VFJ58_01865 [Armatimonadota bacterium]|nr:hypothetical protein [Armatimonadota bacterium]